jgi:hypothetical protein
MSLIPIGGEAHLLLSTSAFTLALGAALFFAGRRSAKTFWIGLLLVFALSVISAFHAHAMFRA